MSFAELDNVSKSFGSTSALTGVSFRIDEGEVLAVLGPNGAGKSTAIGILLGLRRPDAGVARLFGADPRAPRSRRLLGVTPQETAFPETLRVGEIVELARAHYESPLSVDALSERFELGKVVARQTGGLSGGERRRLGVALAFVGKPRLAVLDEPTTGLDIEARKAVWAAIRAHRGDGGSVLLTTHHLAEAEALADRVVVIESGTVVADGTVGEVKADAGMTLVRFRAVPGLDIAGAERDGAYLRILTSARRSDRRPARSGGRFARRARGSGRDARRGTRSTRCPTVRLAHRHAWAMTVELLRYPAYLVPTLILPSVFFLFFVSPGPHRDASVRMATFAGFAVIGVAFFQFGVGIAIDRASPWETYLRTLPLGPAIRVAARLVSATFFACAAAGLLLVTAVATTGVSSRLRAGRAC